MLFRIHMEYDDGSKDFIDVEGDSIEEIQNQAEREVQMRNPLQYWSEELN